VEYFDPWRGANEGAKTLATLGNQITQDVEAQRQRKIADQQYQQTRQLSGLQIQKAQMDLSEAMRGQQIEQGARDALATPVDQSQGPAQPVNHDKVLLDYYRKADPGKAAGFEKLMLDKYKALSEIDPKHAVEWYSQVSGQKLEYAGEKDGYSIIHTTDGTIVAVNKTNPTDVKMIQKGEPKPAAIGNEFQVFVDSRRKAGKTDAAILNEWNEIELGRKKAGATRVSQTVTTREETEEAKAVGKGQGERYNEIIKAGDTGIKNKSQYSRLEQLLEGVNTGKLTPAGTQVAAVANSLGLNIDKNLGNKQAAVALTNMLALELRNPAGGAGMPGAMSDKDREFLTASVPSLSQSPEGNKLMIQYAKAIAQRNIDVARLATAYRRKNKTLDIGFNDELAAWSESHPLFTTEAKPSPSAPSVVGKPAPTQRPTVKPRNAADYMNKWNR